MGAESFICEKKIHALEARLFDNSAIRMSDVEFLINQGFHTLSNLDKFYFNADTKMKRQVVGSIFPEKLVFDGFT